MFLALWVALEITRTARDSLPLIGDLTALTKELCFGLDAEFPVLCSKAALAGCGSMARRGGEFPGWAFQAEDSAWTLT
jgi:hypothetical protein